MLATIFMVWRTVLLSTADGFEVTQTTYFCVTTLPVGYWDINLQICDQGHCCGLDISERYYHCMLSSALGGLVASHSLRMAEEESYWMRDFICVCTETKKMKKINSLIDLETEKLPFKL